MSGKISLVVLAAGMGSRYGGIKQMDSFGPGGAAIIDYSLYDAWKSGFSKAVFIIKKSIEADFKALFHEKWKNRLELHYVFQEPNVPIEGIDEVPPRKKPWGTGEAMMVAAPAIEEPFAIINADDYYGREAFEGIGEFLRNRVSPGLQAMAGYELGNTLSEYGTVSRGVCWADENGRLQKIIECKSLLRKGDRIVQEGLPESFDSHRPVSMNFWGFHPSVLAFCAKGFYPFALAHLHDPSAEYFIPLVVNNLIESGESAVEIVPCGKRWFGVTYQEDKPLVTLSLAKLVEQGEYPENLWA